MGQCVVKMELDTLAARSIMAEAFYPVCSLCLMSRRDSMMSPRIEKNNIDDQLKLVKVVWTQGTSYFIP